MYQTIDLEATIKIAPTKLTKAFIAREFGMKWRSIQYWCTGSEIPPAKNEKLIKLFRDNNIEPIWRNK